MYVFDNSPLSTLFRNYYRNRFPSLWKNFDGVVDQGSLVSTREAFREIMDGQITELREWAKNNQGLFATPTAAQGHSHLSGMTISRSLVSTTKMARSLAGSVLLALWLTW